MKKIIIITALIALSLMLIGCTSTNSLPNGQKTQIANPASEHCIEQGGELELRTQVDGGQYGVCIFDTYECEEWAFFYGNCQDPSLPVNYTTTIIGIEGNRVDLLFGDIAERFTYNGDLSNFKINDNVRVTYVDEEYGRNVLITLEHVNIEVTDFDSCAAAGNPVMESYPMQCSHDGNTYTQVIEERTSFKGTIVGIENGMDGSTVKLEDEEGRTIFATLSIPNLGPDTDFDFSNIEKENMIRVSGTTFEMSGKTYLTADYAITVYSKADKEKCESTNGTYEPFGMLQAYICNMPAKDAGQTCKDSSECEGLCTGKGVCSDLTDYDGCNEIMENGEVVTICID